MSELVQKHDDRTINRLRLLAGVSALALSSYTSAGNVALAEDNDRPQVWIDLGGQLSRLQDSQETFAPSLMDVRPSYFDPSQKFEKPPRRSVDEEGRISFQPKESDWIFSASVRYGRVTSKKDVHQQTSSPAPFYKYPGAPPTYPLHYGVQFAETRSKISEQHTVLDFQVGKDVGLGVFGGRGGSSILNFGIRFAQFQSKTNVMLRSDPDWAIRNKYAYGYNFPLQAYHLNSAFLSADREFHGIGPSLSLVGSAPFLGSHEAGELTFDWGVNAAILFGKQKTRTHHQTTGRYHSGFARSSTATLRPITTQGPTTPDHLRSRSVTVPNVGGFAGISLRYPNAKVSFGYKADFFFGAMDGGIDVRRTEDIGFHGPFATISIGLGG